MTNTPHCSIIVPIYNAETYLAQTLASVQAQTFRDWELIAVDDGSQDGSAEIVRIYAADDPRLHLVKQSNHGVAIARNRGYQETNPNSEYLIFLDNDDLWEPDTLATLITALQDDLTACAAHCQTRYIDADGQPHRAEFIAQQHAVLEDIIQSRRTVVNDHVESRAEALRTTFATFAVGNCILSPGAVLLRRRCLPDPPLFDTTYAPCDDWHLWARLAREADFLFVPRILFNYRLHLDNASRNQAAMDAAWRAVMRYIVTSPDNTPEQAAIARIAFTYTQAKRVGLRLTWAREALRRGQFSQAARQFRHAARYYQWGRQLTGNSVKLR